MTVTSSKRVKPIPRVKLWKVCAQFYHDDYDDSDADDDGLCT